MYHSLLENLCMVPEPRIERKKDLSSWLFTSVELWIAIDVYSINCIKESYSEYLSVRSSVTPMAYQSKKTDLSMWHLQTHSFQSVIAKCKTTSSIRLTRLLIGVWFGRWSTRNTRSDKMPLAPRLMTWFSYSRCCFWRHGTTSVIVLWRSASMIQSPFPDSWGWSWERYLPTTALSADFVRLWRIWVSWTNCWRSLTNNFLAITFR